MAAILYNGGSSQRVLAPEQAGYMAGLIDGEGSLTIGRAKRLEHRSGFTYFAVLTVANTCLDGLYRVVEMCGNGKIQVQDKRSNILHRPVYRVLFGANQIRHLLPQIQPYLLIKRRQAEVLLEFLDSKAFGHHATNESLARHERLRSEIRTLNLRGIKNTAPEPVTLRDEWHRPIVPCSVDGCGNPNYGQSLCYDHYYQRVIKPKHEAAKAAVDRERVCVVCGATFRLSRLKSLEACSKKCRDRHYYKAHADRIKAQVAAAKERRKQQTPTLGS